jgi:3-oxoacyl-[acyl-carrier protein] reductase
MATLSGKIALVTGGSRGIGRAIAQQLVAEGASVAFTYSNSKLEAESLAAESDKLKAYQADAANPNNMTSLAKAMLKDFGKVDFLINNAGVFGESMIGATSDAEYQHMFNVNVGSVFALTNAIVPHMQSGSRIINISSCLGERATGAGMSSYVASKFAVSGFTRGWAKDLGAKGILVNAVLPGPVDTEMNPANSDYSEFQKAQTALGRYGKPEEIAAAVLFLCSSGASFITGSTITVDGGWNA